jgi:hypothetical protein
VEGEHQQAAAGVVLSRRLGLMPYR